MSATTTFVHRPLQVSHRQFPRLNRCSTLKLDFHSQFFCKKSISHSTRYAIPLIMDSMKNRAATGDEGISHGGLEQEGLIDGSMNFSSGGIQTILNGLSKWLMAAVFGIIFLWRHDMEVLWVTSGGALNVLLSTALKRILNHERPVPTLRSDPGMPSSHAQSIFYTMAFCIISRLFFGAYITSTVLPRVFISSNALVFVKEYFGLNGITAVSSALIFAMCSYFSWLRVSQGLHTLSQVAVGAVLGFCFSIFWFWLWDAIVMKAFIAHFWVQIVAVVAAAGFIVGFLLYVIRNWINDD